MTARFIKITLGVGATPIASSPTYFNQMIVQNAVSTVAYLGDANVSSTNGMSLAASLTADSVANIGPFVGMQGDASQFYLAGTQGNTVNVLLV